MPLSPTLSNLFLNKIDRIIAKRGIAAIRYVDDIVAFGTSEQECEVIYRQLEAELAKIGCTVYPLGTKGKAQIYPPRHALEFLGIDIKEDGPGKYAVWAPFSKLPKIKKKLSDMASRSYCLANNVSYGNLARSLECYIGGYEGTLNFARHSADFGRRLHNIREEALIGLLEELVGKDVARGLGNEEKMILGTAPFPRKKKQARTD